MSFKSKTDFNAFDKNNTKVKNLEVSKTKGLTKTATKKLVNKMGERVPYHLVLEYFVNEAGKVLGHFLDFGENKKLSKHFEQVEMKPGKLNKSMSESPKKACTGFAFVQLISGKKVVHIEPSSNSKIPKGQWPKILKALKPFLGGLKAVVVIGGEVLEFVVNEDEGSEILDTNEQIEEKPVTNEQSTAELIKQLILEITAILKNQLPKEILPNIKAKNVSQEDLYVTNDLFDKIYEFQAAYANAEIGIQQKISKHYDTIVKQLPKLEKIETAIENLLGISDEWDEDLEPNEDDNIAMRELKKFLAYLKNEEQAINKRLEKAQASIANAATVFIAEGEALLSALFN